MYYFIIFRSFRVLGLKKRLTPWPHINAKFDQFIYFLGSEHMGYHVNWQRVSKDEMSICDLSPKKLDISSQFQHTRRFAFKKTFKRCIIRVPDWKLARLLSRFCFGRICPAVTFYFNAPLKTETAGDMQNRAHVLSLNSLSRVLSLNSLWIRLFSSDDKVKLMNNPSQIHR